LPGYLERGYRAAFQASVRGRDRLALAEWGVLDRVCEYCEGPARVIVYMLRALGQFDFQGRMRRNSQAYRQFCQKFE
jgi:hypothetical protein